MLLSWLLELQGELGFASTTVHSCVLMMDRFASSVSVPESLLQLLLAACLYIAGWSLLFLKGLSETCVANPRSFEPCLLASLQLTP